MTTSTEISNDELLELLTLTIEVNKRGDIIHRNSYGELHRIHGPAIIYLNGDEEWYQHDKLHREDGPAVIDPSGYTAWYQHGIQIREERDYAI
jgi:hypothetical protein